MPFFIFMTPKMGLSCILRDRWYPHGPAPLLPLKALPSNAHTNPAFPNGPCLGPQAQWGGILGEPSELLLHAASSFLCGHLHANRLVMCHLDSSPRMENENFDILSMENGGSARPSPLPQHSHSQLPGWGSDRGPYPKHSWRGHGGGTGQETSGERTTSNSQQQEAVQL